MPNQKNIDQLQTINDKLGQSQSLILTDYSGLSVANQTELRHRISQAGGEFTVQKNRLLKIALNHKLGSLPQPIEDILQGPTAVVYGFQDPVSATKVMVEFAKDNDHLKIKAGLLTVADSPTTVLSLDQIQALATLPSKDELRARVVGQLQAPIFGLVNVLSGNMRSLVNVIKQIKKQQEGMAN